ncbi:hypothetical protein JQ596_18290 [Bradyrhizobium manausense]|uniref:hypothetical protein n=1 Tax=Bradyrhizobium manausense TaxID=989370 RepID=UPI001BA93254|nr:hypothetical protein [Bradyrhizobium manausense]MBR0827479.1 hypothetical protein [Bradyrhizobium manausense]
MKAVKILFSIVFLAILTSNVRLISHWTESRGVYDDICYLRQAHLFQRFGWQGLDTSLAREDDGYLASKLRSINFENWKDGTKAPCHTQTADGSKWVMTPPPGTGFVLALFPEGFQAIPLYALANMIIAGFALYGLWRAGHPGALALAASFGAVSIYFMINPAKASYSIAPTMVVCALAGLLTARLFDDEDRPRLLMLALVGALLGLSASFRIANVLLSAGYFLFFGVSFLVRRDQKTFMQGLSLGLGFLVGILPVLAANMVNSGHPLVSAYGGQDTQAPSLDLAVLRAYLGDTQFPVILLLCLWTALLWRFSSQFCVRRLALLVAGNLALNLAFFATHPVFTQYYTLPIVMLTLWTALFATIFSREMQGMQADGPQPSEMLSRVPI